MISAHNTAVIDDDDEMAKSMMTCKIMFSHNIKPAGPHAPIMVALYSSAAVLNVLSNSILLYSVWKLKLQNRPIYKLIIIMTVSDLLTGIVVLPLTMYFFWIPNCFASIYIIQPLYFFQVAFANCMIVLVAIDRFLHMKYLLRYGSIMSNQKSNILIAGSAFVSSVAAGLSVLASVKDLIFQVYLSITIVGGVIFSFTALLYFKAFKAVRNRVRCSQLTTANERPDARFLRAALLVTLSLVVCYVPALIMGCVRMFKKFYKHRETDYVDDLAFTIACSGISWYSFLNAAIWIYNDSKIWQFLKAFIPCSHQQDRRSAVSRSDDSNNNSNATCGPNMAMNGRNRNINEQFQLTSNNNNIEEESPIELDMATTTQVTLKTKQQQLHS